MTQKYIVYNRVLRQYWLHKETGITPRRSKAFKFTRAELEEAWPILHPAKAKQNLRIIPVAEVV